MQTVQIAQQRLFLIDAATAAARSVTEAVNNIPGVIHIERPNPYREDPMYCQLLVMANDDITEQHLDDMLWSNNLDYVGVVEMTCH